MQLLIPPYNAGDTAFGTRFPLVERLQLTPEELRDLGEWKQKIDAAYTVRQQEWQEFDDMTYSQYYEGNAKAANAYIRSKLNDQDVRVVTGTTKEKDNALIAMLLNYNLEPDIEAYDKDDLLVKELGTIMEDMIKKSRKIELPDYEIKRPLIYQELIAQGNVFIEEVWQNMTIPKKVFTDDSWKDSMDPYKMKWKESEETFSQCNMNIISGLDVYPGNAREFYMELQPYIGLRREITRAEAYALYGDWERWKYVPYTVTKVRDDDADIRYHNWYAIDTNYEMVEVIICEDKWRNRFQIILNGIPMLPPEFPLSYFTGESEYTLIKGDIEPISRFFFWSKSIPAKTKMDQAAFDEMLKSIILKLRKSYDPPYVNNTGVMLSKKVFFPGNLSSGIDTTKIVPLERDKIDGVSQGEMAGVQFIKQIIDEKTINPVMQGQQTKGKKTAREIIEMKQQSLQKLGLTIYGVVNLEKKLAKARLVNIVNHWTQPIDMKIEKTRSGIKALPVYRTITVGSQFEDGQRGKRIIEFSEDLPEEEQINAEAMLLSDKYEEPVTKNYIDPKMLRSMELSWYIEIVPTEKDTSELKSAMFTEHIIQAKQIWGPQSVNDEYAKQRWALHIDENPDKFFVKQNQQQQMMQQQAASGQQQEEPPAPMGDQIKPKGQPFKPSPTALLNQ